MILPIIVRPCLFGAIPERPFAPGERNPAAGTWGRVSGNRLDRLPRRRACGREVAVARGFRSRLLGLARLDRSDAGTGLLIPRCRSVHTFGMRFELDLVFLDRDGRILAVHRQVPPRRVVRCPGADAVLEVPAPEGGEFSPAGDLGGHVAAAPGNRQHRRL